MSPSLLTTSDLSQHISIDSTIGALLVGTFSSIFLTGITYLQACQYWRSFTKDPMLLKIWVGRCGLCYLQIFGADFRSPVVSHFGTPTFFVTSPLVWSARVRRLELLFFPSCRLAKCNTLTASTDRWTQSVMTYGILLNQFLCTTFMDDVPNVPSGGDCSVLSIKMFQAQNILELFDLSNDLTLLAVDDYSGLHHTNDCGRIYHKFPNLRFIPSPHGIQYKVRTDSKLDLLAAYAFSTGLVTWYLYKLYLELQGPNTRLAATVWPHDLIWVTPACTLVKLYANNLLTALNSRKALGIMDSDDRVTAYSWSSRRFIRGLTMSTRYEKPQCFGLYKSLKACFVKRAVPNFQWNSVRATSVFPAAMRENLVSLRSLSSPLPIYETLKWRMQTRVRRHNRLTLLAKGHWATTWAFIS
ncbi:hypothetical protein DICSQDRAFT_127781 [Dichomitus squalens LYAD-421 SS1]|uniref:DUF6534 domain-containing protein n=1 Tax=Dichomitus squalens (strain LYAD-421) TaxID=732165 RepID=R7SX31_DICSQ|nr:uncharacterized protein DICSQDRAFT_127781 [Dichomitus squalens LYAD-421 SS1]EJF60275.1 hypothetical protein DICSQDRAFT_127781 [Dichomitus squalens LYAD-421 SS1]